MLKTPTTAVYTPRLRLVAGALLALLPFPASARAADARPDFAGKLPARVGAWKRSARPALYDRKTLYDYIDGGAELYLAFGFEGAITFEYSADQDDEIKVDIFDMGSPRGAFGAFAHGRESIAAEVGQGSEYGGGLLTFWKQRWFVSVLGYPETMSKRKAVYALGRAVATLIPETGTPPAIVNALPKPGLVEASVRTFHHPSLQNDYVTISYENPLRIGQQTEAVLARYVRQTGRHVLMVVDYPTEADSKAGERGFTDSVLGGAAVANKGTEKGTKKGTKNGKANRDSWAGVKRIGKRLILVLDAPSRQIADQVLSEVP